jgi:peroxin-19
MATKDEAQEKVDAVLDAALDDLDDDDEDDDDDDVEDPKQSPPSQISSRPVQGPPPPPSSNDAAGMNTLDAMMRDLMQSNFDVGDNDQADEFLGKLLQEMQSQIGSELEQMQNQSPSKPKSPSKAKSPQEAKSPASTSSPSSSSKAKQQSSSNDVDQAISSLIEGMTNQAKLDEPIQNGTKGLSEAEMLKAMMDQLGEGLGSEGEDAGLNADALIDGMMEQLLAKDLMYEPMKKVAEKFPEWLERNKGKLPREEYDQ